MSSWARTIWVGVVLVVPGGFLLFLAYAFGRALLRARRATVAGKGRTASPARAFVQLSLKDVLREVRTSM